MLWCIPVILMTEETEAGELLELGGGGQHNENPSQDKKLQKNNKIL